MSKLKWYSAKTIVSWQKPKGKLHGIEERIVLIKGKNQKNAVIKAETEAEEYCLNRGSEIFRTYEGILDVSEIYASEPDENVQVYGSLSGSHECVREYLNRRYPLYLLDTRTSDGAKRPL